MTNKNKLAELIKANKESLIEIGTYDSLVAISELDDSVITLDAIDLLAINDVNAMFDIEHEFKDANEKVQTLLSTYNTDDAILQAYNDLVVADWHASRQFEQTLKSAISKFFVYNAYEFLIEELDNLKITNLASDIVFSSDLQNKLIYNAQNKSLTLYHTANTKILHYLYAMFEFIIKDQELDELLSFAVTRDESLYNKALQFKPLLRKHFLNLRKHNVTSVDIHKSINDVDYTMSVPVNEIASINEWSNGHLINKKRMNSNAFNSYIDYLDDVLIHIIYNRYCV